MKFGFVKFTSGKYKGRIGRYTRNSDNKAVISFSYLIDIVPYSFFDKVSLSSISNNITKVDLLDRYYNLSSLLIEIDHTANKEIRKYSLEHQNLILELSLVRHLISKYFDIKNLDENNYKNNTVIITSSRDFIYTSDLLLELELNGNNTHILDIDDIIDYNIINKYLHFSKSILFIITENTINDNRFKDLLNYINSNSITSNIYYISNIITDEKHNNILYIDDIYDSSNEYVDKLFRYLGKE